MKNDIFEHLTASRSKLEVSPNKVLDIFVLKVHKSELIHSQSGDSASVMKQKVSQTLRQALRQLLKASLVHVHICVSTFDSKEREIRTFCLLTVFKQ